MNPRIFLRSTAVAMFLSFFIVFSQRATFSVQGAPEAAVTVRKNIAYVTNGAPRQNFDLYLPENKSGKPLPLIVWIHGGAWMAGDKDWNDVRYLIDYGYALASIDYRFSQEAKFPAQIQDCNAALNFILAHAADYGIDPKRFAVGGGSAGGHLALLLGMARQETNFDANPSIKPLAILDFFGPTDLKVIMADLQAIHSEKGLKLLEEAGTSLFGSSLDKVPEKAKNASPMTYVNSNSPPVLILQGVKDDLVPKVQSERLQSALDRANVVNRLILIEDAGHAGPLFSNPESGAKVIQFLKDILQK